MAYLKIDSPEGGKALSGRKKVEVVSELLEKGSVLVGLLSPPVSLD